jgi:Na+/proline symporter
MAILVTFFCSCSIHPDFVHRSSLLMPEISAVNAVDYGLIFLYFLIVIAVGVYASRKNKGTDDYFKAGGEVPWFMAGVSNWVSGFSAFMFVAAAGYTYKNGSGALILFTSAFWAYLGGYYYFAPAWRRARIQAPLEFLNRRYSVSTTYFYTLSSFVPQIIGIAMGLYILCIFVSSALGFDREVFNVIGFQLNGLELSMLVVGVVMVLYSVIGGLWAAVLSDAVQGVIILVMSLLIFPISLSYLGADSGIMAGITRLFDELPREYLIPSGQPIQPFFLISYFLSVFLGYNVSWHLVQRYNSVPNESGARKMAMLCAWLSLFGPLLWVLPVMGSKLIFPDMATLWPNLMVPEEASFVSLAMLLLPHGMIGFVVAAILSATLGQANDAFNWMSAAISKDVYVPIRRKLGYGSGTDKHQMRIAQLAMLVMGVSGIAMAFVISRLGGAFDFGLKYYSMVGPGFFMPVMLGLVYRKTPWWSGLATCLSAFTVVFIMFFFDIFSGHEFERNILGAIITSFIVFGITTRWYVPGDPANAHIEALDRDLRTPVPEIEEDPARYGSLQEYKLIGLISILLGVVLMFCFWVPTTLLAPAFINVIGGLMLIAIGGILWWWSGRGGKSVDKTI